MAIHISENRTGSFAKVILLFPGRKTIYAEKNLASNNCTNSQFVGRANQCELCHHLRILAHQIADRIRIQEVDQWLTLTAIAKGVFKMTRQFCPFDPSFHFVDIFRW